MEAVFLRHFLNSAASSYRNGYLETDPVGIVHQFTDPMEIETTGLFASSLALGRVSTIREKTLDLIDRFDGRPAGFLISSSRRQIEERLDGFRHRFYKSDDLLELSLNVRRILKKYGGLEGAWPRGGDLRRSLEVFAADLARPDRRIARRSSLPLVVSPQRGSTCKRILLFLRWMVRRPDGIDFGIWSRVHPRQLIIPMDTHVFRLSKALGLTRRKSAGWNAAVEVTDALKKIDFDDPVRFDFALSRLGIVENCRGKFVKDVCSRCPVRKNCVLIPAGSFSGGFEGSSGAAGDNVATELV